MKTKLAAYAAIAVAWVAGMVYEGMWSGGEIGAYVGLGAVGLSILVGALVRSATKNQRNNEPRPMEWFMLAALVVALFYLAVDKAALMDPPHVLLLPVYPILFLDFFLSGCYTWWKKLR